MNKMLSKCIYLQTEKNDSKNKQKKRSMIRGSLPWWDWNIEHDMCASWSERGKIGSGEFSKIWCDEHIVLHVHQSQSFFVDFQLPIQLVCIIVVTHPFYVSVYGLFLFIRLFVGCVPIFINFCHVTWYIWHASHFKPIEKHSRTHHSTHITHSVNNWNPYVLLFIYLHQKKRRKEKRVKMKHKKE